MKPGSVDFNQDQSDKGAPTMSETELYKALSRDWIAPSMNNMGHVRRIKTNLGSDKHKRKRTYSICESSNFGKRFNIPWILFTPFRVCEEQKEGDPTGAPKRTKPSLPMGISEERGLLVRSATTKTYFY